MSRRYLWVVVAGAAAAGCAPDEPTLTIAEATDAVVEVSSASLAMRAIGVTLELGASFTIGDDPEVAAASIAEALALDAPCASIEVDGAAIAVSYDGSCPVLGQALAGEQEIEVVASAEDGVVIDHSFTALSAGAIEVSGFAEVSFSAEDETHYVWAELEWTRLDDGRTGSAAGEYAQWEALGGLVEGLAFEGYLDWSGLRGGWNATFSGEMRWIDAVPQIGSWLADTAYRKTATLDFQRVDASSIAVAVSGPGRTFDLVVGPEGEIQ